MDTQTQARKHKARGYTIAIAILLLVLAIAGLIVWNTTRATGTSSSGPSQAGLNTQTNDGGQVTVKVTWQGKNVGPMFALEMDTHAVDLDRYNMRQLAILRTDQGQELAATMWNAPMGGHHRSGTLSFPTTFADGTPVIGPNTHKLTLIIRNVAGIPERMFQWTV